ncbi:ECF transporter S component [Aeromicrobium duanguangcaii]|uniref:ECF transporter S component n=1 Tax=Aeromicrobium duanguangcaii TaxID=2968086 RepID=UPI002016B072|nr:ECF transporter S component [Aeromicrobium duanguangcaii]MCL3838387.1 ECF transporter S component [Aeromicrobium duanguangcaii]
MTSAIRSTSIRYRTLDLVTIAMLGVAFGVVFWGWGKFYDVIDLGAAVGFKPAAGLLAGMWLIAGVVGGLVVRRPGAAFATEMVAAMVSMFVLGGTAWGGTVLLSGIVQGLGAELIFALFLYRRFDVVAAMLAGTLAAVFACFYEWYFYWPDWDLQWRLAYLGFFTVSGVVIAGLGGWLLVRRLAQAGALDSFPAGRP